MCRRTISSAIKYFLNVWKENSGNLVCCFQLVLVTTVTDFIVFPNININLFFRGTAFLGTQIYLINQKFRNLLPSETFTRERQYVYIKSPEYYISLGDSAAEKYLGAEQIVQTLVRGPKSIASDSNPWHLLRILRSEAYSNEHDKVLRTLASATYSGKVSYLALQYFY